MHDYFVALDTRSRVENGLGGLEAPGQYIYIYMFFLKQNKTHSHRSTFKLLRLSAIHDYFVALDTRSRVENGLGGLEAPGQYS